MPQVFKIGSYWVYFSVLPHIFAKNLVEGLDKVA